jgi:hypothetical protein
MSAMSSRFSSRVLGIALAILFVTTGLASADKAEKVNPAFAGKVQLSDKRFPGQAKSLAAFNAAIRKQSKTSFNEDKEKKWRIYFAAFLKAPLNDVEYLVKLYDVSNRNGQQLVASFEQFTDGGRGQTTLLSNMILERKTIGVNKQLMITIESKGRVLASNRFKILGQAEKFSGKVDFSEEEATKGTKEDE